jgi:predicted RNA-binding Zn ribbon-like protein
MQHIPTVLDHGFEYIGGDLSTDFINTKSGRLSGDGHEHVQTYADVVDFVRLAGLLKPAEAKRLIAAAEAHPERATQIHRRAVALREATFRAYDRVIQQKEPAREDMELISREAADAMAHAQMLRTADGWEWGWSETDVLARPLWPIARAALDVLTNAPERQLLRQCSDDTCAWLFVDRTKNHSRRWCDVNTCGSRNRVREFRQRRKRVARKSR